MKRFLLLGLLAALLGLGATRPWMAHRSNPACGCCTTSADCPTPSCCLS